VNILLVSVIQHHCQTIKKKRIRPTDPILAMFPQTTDLFLGSTYILGHITVIWSPNLKGDIEAIERVQRHGSDHRLL